MIARLSYYFPTWFLQRVVIIRSSYNPTTGHLLSVRTPRQRPINDIVGLLIY